MTDISLTGRAGLPPELRVLADRYPADSWRGHANFSELTAFWLDRHGMFREVMDRLVTQAQTQLDTPGDRFLHEMSQYASFLLNQLHSHHMIEDHHYFPQLIKLDSRIERAFDLLDQDHQTLDAELKALADTANACIQAQAERDSVARLLNAEERLHAFLDRHLADEEDIVVPLILEYAPGLQ